MIGRPGYARNAMPNPPDTQESVLALMSARTGHFLLESGHHGELWLELDALFWEPAALEPLAHRLAEQIRPHAPEVVCGPLEGGAFLAQLVAARLGVRFCHSERAGADLRGRRAGSEERATEHRRSGSAPQRARSPADAQRRQSNTVRTSMGDGGLYAATYRLPDALAVRLPGLRVAVVDDVVNAGSAVRATLAALTSAGAQPVALGALLALGATPAAVAAAVGLPLEAVATRENQIWEPEHCPLCARREPLQTP
jgi:orotate phosphoribosyltransferase